MAKPLPTTLLTLAILAGGAPLPAQTPPRTDIAEPFKVGTFEIGGEARVGMVLRDALVVDIGAANRALERDPAYPRIPMPADMLDLIARYEYGVKPRLYEIVNHLAAHDLIDSATRPGFVHAVNEVRTLPPIMYPGKIMNAAVNFYSHVNETGTPEERAEARRQRRENRGVPYLYGDPMENLHQTLSVGGEQMQEARAGDMIHTLYELIEYGSSIITLFPGDVINNGTSGGVGMGTAVRGEQRFLRPGDVIEATIEGIGTLTIPVVGEEEPAGGTGARLPPVRSYRGRR